MGVVNDKTHSKFLVSFKNDSDEHLLEVEVLQKVVENEESAASSSRTDETAIVGDPVSETESEKN